MIRARVNSNSEMMPGTRLIWLDAPEIAGSARPGQFVMVRCAEGHDPLLRRPLSIHGTDGSGAVALLFEVAGRGTSWLSGRAPGDLVDVVGPLGNGFSASPGAKSLLLVAGGIGIAPLAFLAGEASLQGKAVTLLQGAAQGASLLYPRHQTPPNCTVVSVSEDGVWERKGLVTGWIAEFIVGADQVFACGPEAMYRSMAGLHCLTGIPVQVSLEERMACGLGACYGCAVRTTRGVKQTCSDGPVFELADIIW